MKTPLSHNRNAAHLWRGSLAGTAPARRYGPPSRRGELQGRAAVLRDTGKLVAEWEVRLPALQTRGPETAR